MSYWLLKSEPNIWSISQQKKAGVKGAPWDGVRNYQAANNLKKMKEGDLCLLVLSKLLKLLLSIQLIRKKNLLLSKLSIKKR